MILREFIQRVQSLYGKGLQSVSSRLTPRHIYSAMLTGRSVLIRQQVNKGQAISEWNYQNLPCVELITAPIHECPCVPVQGCKILRSKFKLPKPITGLEKSLIKSITSLDGLIKFDEESYENVKYSIGNKYTANKPSYYIHNGYLYITVLTILKVVPVRGLFEDYLEAAAFANLCGNCENCECNDILDTEIPIDGHLIRPLLQLTYDELIVMFKQMTEDRNNNTKDDTASTGSMVHTPQQQPE